MVESNGFEKLLLQTNRDFVETCVQSLAGGFVFNSSLILSQALGGILTISSSTPIVAPVFGSLSIISACLFTSQTLQHFREIDFPNNIIYHNVGYDQPNTRGALEEERPLLFDSLYDPDEFEYIDYLNALQYSVAGLFMFRILGGRLTSALPSDLLQPGTFHKSVLSIPATANYASGVKRELIKSFGSNWGCHSCGVRSSKVYIADHQPPNKISELKNNAFMRKYFGSGVVQKFYPHCDSCSQRQGGILIGEAYKKINSRLVYHFLTFRSYHLTGFFLAWMKPLNSSSCS